MNLLVISSYPEKAALHGKKTVGVGNYTKATLLALAKSSLEAKIRVFAEVHEGKESYLENKIQVERFWKRGNILSQIALFTKAFRAPEKKILFPFEMFMLGGFLNAIIMLPLMLLLKIGGKKIFLVLHQVVGDDISKFEKNKVKAYVFSAFRRAFYAYLVFISYKVVVFEEELKYRIGAGKKVVVIPHAVIQEKVLDKEASREKLGLDREAKYAFYFGFLSPYKGVDKLLEIWEDMEGIKLIIGGGGNPNHMRKSSYKKYVDSIIGLAKEKDALATGFIPEEEMPLYFSAVDLVILPYTVFVSSSGPLSHAFSWGNGVLLSEPLRSYFDSHDMKQALDESDISVEEICFALDRPIRSKILWAMHNIDKLRDFSVRMRQVRSWDSVGKMYRQVLEE